MNHSDTNDSHLTKADLSSLMSEARNRYKIPAIAVMVMNSDTIFLQEIIGVRVFDKPDLATLDDYFHIGSCSKSVLAVMAAKLIEQNKLTWQSKFFDVFPELKENAKPDYHNISLEDLLLCEAGIKPFTNAKTEQFPEYGPSVMDKRLAFIKHLIEQPPSSRQKKGKFKHIYSNASYTMAAAMLEKISGQKYEELVKNSLRDGFGLTVHIGWPNSISAEQPWGHHIAKDKIESLPPDHQYRLPFLITPAGDLSMTVKDYAKYTHLHLQGLMGVDNYLSCDSYEYIHFRHKGFSLGIGNGVMNGRRFSGFDGSAGTFFCRSIIAPESNFAFTIMTNAGSDSGISRVVEWLTMKLVKKHFNWWWKFWL